MLQRIIWKKILRTTAQVEKSFICNFSSVKPEIITDEDKNEPNQNLLPIRQTQIDFIKTYKNPQSKSLLDKCEDDISHIAPYLKPTFNLASYVNKSETLQQFVKLNVDLFKIEKNRDISKYILGLDFEKDVKNHVIFLSELGLDVETLGQFITKNPLIFQEDLDDLQVRINYLLSKKFDEAMITRIVGRNPKWLSLSTKQIDEKLGFFQGYFSLTGNEVRALAVRQPKLITYNLNSVKQNTFSLKEEMGFTEEECKSIILLRPNLLMKETRSMMETFEYIHNEMEIPLETLVIQPEVLTCRTFRVKQRHEFLKFINKAQYNPKKEGYVSILTLVSGCDEEFCLNVAKCPLITFTTFLKTM